MGKFTGSHLFPRYLAIDKKLQERRWENRFQEPAVEFCGDASRLIKILKQNMEKTS